MGIGQGHPRRRRGVHQQLGSEESVDVVVRVGALHLVEDMAGRPRVTEIARDAKRNVIAAERPRGEGGNLPCFVVSDNPASAIFRREARVVGIDENRSGDRILPLGGRLRASEDFDTIDVPHAERAEHQLVVGDRTPIDDDRRPRPVSAEKCGKGKERAGRIQPADCRPLASVSELDIGDQRQQLVDVIGAARLDFVLADDGNARRSLAQGARHPFAGNDDLGRLFRRHGLLLSNGRGEQQRTGYRGHSPLEFPLSALAYPCCCRLQGSGHAPGYAKRVTGTRPAAPNCRRPSHALQTTCRSQPR